jgi:hypothetical protein
MRIDFTLTLPGMFEIVNIQRLAKELNVDVLAKVVFSFSPDIVMSPLALPRSILDPWIDEILVGISSAPLRDTLLQLKTRPTFEEQWPEQYQQGIRRGKQRILRLEKIRNHETTFTDIMAERLEVLEWWMQIENS